MGELVSVIITTCNRNSCYIERALKSVMAQTYENIEIIVVDDNRADYSIKETIKQTIKGICPQAVYCSHNKNLGAPAARNTGIRIAKGDYIAFLDDDDEWLPDKVEK